MENQVGQIKQFFKAVYERRRLFIIAAAGFALLAVGASFFIPKRYEAKSTVFIERNILDSLMKGLTVSPSMVDRIRVLRYYMVSRDMVVKTLKRLDMDTLPGYADSEKFDSLVRKCQAQTDINVRGQDLFMVSMVDLDPAFARDYINNLINIYVEENLADKREESYGANRFLDEQVVFYKKKLDEIDTQIIDFRKQTGIYSSVNESSVMAQVAKDEEALKEIRGQKTQIYATIKTIKQQLEMLRETTALGFSSSLGELAAGNGEDARIGQLEAKIQELLLFYNEQYPTVVKLRDQIEELKKRQAEGSPVPQVNNEEKSYNPVEDPIYVDLKMRQNSAQSDLNALVAKEQELMASIDSNQSLLRNYPKDKKALNDLEQARALQADIYQQLLERVGVSEVSKQMEVADKSTTFRIVDPAILPTVPVGPQRIFLMLLGIVGGVMAGLGVVYLAEQSDNTYRSSQSLRDLGVTILAEIPFIWSERDIQLVRRKDKTALALATVCALLIGAMMLHDLLGMSVIDRVIENLSIHKA